MAFDTSSAVHRSMAWVNKLRLRMIVFVIGVPLAAFGAISIGPAWIALPMVGVAVALVTVSLSKLSQRMTEQICLTCGENLSDLPAHEHGIVCPSCGSLNQHNPALLAGRDTSKDPKGTSVA